VAFLLAEELRLNMLKLFSIFMAALFVLLGVILGLLNPHEVYFDGYLIQGNFPLSILMAASFILGMLGVSGVFSAQLIKLKWQLSKRQKQLDRLNAQLAKMKTEQLMLQNKTK